MIRDHEDALIEQLLREFLGGDRPRDLTQRVLVQAKAYDRIRWRWWTGTAASIAAAVAIAAMIWFARPGPYSTAVAVNGSFKITNGNGTLQRGAIIETTAQDHATIRIGGYVSVTIAPETRFTIGGENFKENLILDYGRLDLIVDKNKGSFDVAVGPADVHVTGTQFDVQVNDQEDEQTGTIVKNMMVSVKDGSVLISGVVDGGPLTAHNSKTFPIWEEILPKGTASDTSPLPPNNGVTAPSGSPAIQFGGAPSAGQGTPSTTQTTQGASPGGAAAGGRSGGAAGPATRGDLNIINGVGRAGPLYRTVPTTDHFEQTGTLQLLVPQTYVLQTDTGRYRLFSNPQEIPAGFSPPPSGSKVRVIWNRGKFESIELPTDAPTSAPSALGPTVPSRPTETPVSAPRPPSTPVELPPPAAP